MIQNRSARPPSSNSRAPAWNIDLADQTDNRSSCVGLRPARKGCAANISYTVSIAPAPPMALLDLLVRAWRAGVRYRQVRVAPGTRDLRPWAGARGWRSVDGEPTANPTAPKEPEMH